MCHMFIDYIFLHFDNEYTDQFTVGKRENAYCKWSRDSYRVAEHAYSNFRCLLLTFKYDFKSVETL